MREILGEYKTTLALTPLPTSLLRFLSPNNPLSPGFNTKTLGLSIIQKKFGMACIKQNVCQKNCSSEINFVVFKLVLTVFDAFYNKTTIQGKRKLKQPISSQSTSRSVIFEES